MAKKDELKIPPQDLEAESSVLGSLLLESDAIIKVADFLSAEDFYHPPHQIIYQTILDLFNKNKPVDLLSVKTELKEKKLLKNIGGVDYLTELINSVPTAAHLNYYANVVKEKRIRRELIKASSEITEKAFEPENLETLLDNVEQKIFNISQRSLPKKFVPLKEELTSAYERIEKLHRGEGFYRGLATKFNQLDNLLSGLQKSDLIILGARPSFGKTAFALDISRNVASQNKPVGIFSLEMSQEQVVDRLIAAQANVPLWKLRTGRLNDELEFSMIQNALDELSKMPIFIEDTPSPTILQIRSMARRLQIENGLELLVIDYLQLIQPRIETESMVQQVTEISRGLKSLARELNIPVLAVSQLSRAVDQREIKIPRLSDLRESGCLAGDSLILLADGRRVTIKSLAEKKITLPVKIFALDSDYKLKPFWLTKAFSSGKKEIFELKTQSGRIIKASANHPFLTIEGWKRLDELEIGKEIALPRILPVENIKNQLSDDELILHAHLLGDGCILPHQPYHYTNAYIENIKNVKKSAFKLFGIKGKFVKQKNWYHLYLASPFHLAPGKKHPITEWYEKLGISRAHSYQKQISSKVFQCSNDKISLFLKHLWATDGNLSLKLNKGRKVAGNIYFATTSSILAEQVQHLLLRLSIQSTITQTIKKGYRPTYWVIIQGAENQIRFLEKVNIADRRRITASNLLKQLKKVLINPNNDIVPKKVWFNFIKPAKELAAISWREFANRLEMAYCGSTLFQSGLSRKRMMKVYNALAPFLTLNPEKKAEKAAENIFNLATSDIFWDKITAIKRLGIEKVYDATVPEAHNFIANDIIVHNSLEQDADVVMFIYRKDRENINLAEEEQNLTEIIVAKHRNGPLGSVKLKFDPEIVSFRNIDIYREPE